MKTAIIIGAGPAGLTAAYELATRTDIQPIVLEATQDIGGISRTVEHHGNRIDIGGHRFFSKSKRVMNWWFNIMPLQNNQEIDLNNKNTVFLLRNRFSRIYFLKKFFSYPVTLNFDTINNLGIVRVVKIGLSYLYTKFKTITPEKNLEIFFINRFGKELYSTFFKDYTEKVWGIPCDKIDPSWGAQRIKGLSISKTIYHAIQKIFTKKIENNKNETSLIEEFYYPKLGPGQLWQEVAKKVTEKGGLIVMNQTVKKINLKNNQIISIVGVDERGQEKEWHGDYFFSTMPIKDLLNNLIGDNVDSEAKRVANGLIYRDFITVGLLLSKLKIKNNTKHKTTNDIIPDNWIYIQEPEVKVGRLQIFNNWSPYLVNDPSKVWIGMEYFCDEGDELWNQDEENFKKFAINELANIGIIDKENVEDSIVIKVPKAYPAYFGTYDEFDKIKNFLNTIPNLFPIGRNGMHRYNNQDHSMLTAMTAVDNITTNKTDKENIWSVNVEQDYQEEIEK